VGRSLFAAGNIQGSENKSFVPNRVQNTLTLERA
jgi:hypothetical protein